jgi:hypothetical protein
MGKIINKHPKTFKSTVLKAWSWVLLILFGLLTATTGCWREMYGPPPAISLYGVPGVNQLIDQQKQ